MKVKPLSSAKQQVINLEVGFTQRLFFALGTVASLALETVNTPSWTVSFSTLLLAEVFNLSLTNQTPKEQF